jgi:hypothetical protein
MQIHPLQAEQYSIKKGDLTKTLPVYWIQTNPLLESLT